MLQITLEITDPALRQAIEENCQRLSAAETSRWLLQCLSKGVQLEKEEAKKLAEAMSRLEKEEIQKQKRGSRRGSDLTP